VGQFSALISARVIPHREELIVQHCMRSVPLCFFDQGETPVEPGYVFSAPIVLVVVVPIVLVLVLVVVLVLVSSSAADREGLPGWKRDEWRKQPERASLVPARKTAEDDHDDEDEDDWGMTLNSYEPGRFDTQRSAFGVRRSAFSVRRSAFQILHSCNS
jgi:hypothetical protein